LVGVEYSRGYGSFGSLFLRAHFDGRLRRSNRGSLREVNLSLLATDPPCLSIIGSGSFFSSAECSKPDTDTLPWVTDLSSPFAPWALSDTTVLGLPLSLGRLLSLAVELYRLQANKNKKNEKTS